MLSLFSLYIVFLPMPPAWATLALVPPGLQGSRASKVDDKQELPLSTSHRPIKHTLNPLRQLDRLLRLTLSPRILFLCFIRTFVVLALVIFGSWPPSNCRARLAVASLILSLRAPLFSLDVDCPPSSPSDWPFRKGVPPNSPLSDLTRLPGCSGHLNI
jgi:hypothetical protein